MQSGMDSLGEEDRNEYMSDFKGFISYVRDKGFQTYADKVGALCCRICECLVSFCSAYRRFALLSLSDSKCFVLSRQKHVSMLSARLRGCYAAVR